MITAQSKDNQNNNRQNREKQKKKERKNTQNLATSVARQQFHRKVVNIRCRASLEWFNLSHC